MDFKAEKRKIQTLNKTELSKYEAENKRLLAAATKKAEAAKEERRNKFNKTVCYIGVPDQALVNEALARSEEKRLKDLNSEVQKRKIALLTPEERKAREKKRKELLNRLEKLMAA